MKSQQQAELTLKDRIADFLNNNWRIIVIILAVIVVVMTGILVWNHLNNNRIAASSMLAEDIQDAYTEWTAADEADRDDTRLMEYIDNALEDYSGKFAAQRARFTLGLMAIEKEEWEDAYVNLENLAETWPDSYLAPVSLFNAGSAREEAGDIDGAIADWQKLADNYSTASPDAPEALFNVGRVEEGRGNNDAALEAYKAVGATYPDSRWTDICKSRILVIEGR